MKNTIILLISIATFIACAKQKAEQVSTIDSTLQVRVDSILQNKLSELNATVGQVIIMEVRTGEIKVSVGSDSILQESGLVRIASLLAALETKAVKLSDTIDVDNGTLAIGKDTLCDHNWHRGGYGKITVEQGFGLASNIANYKIVKKAFENEQAFTEALAKYGYQVKDTSLVYNPLGYGILTTPLQNLTIFNNIAKSNTTIKEALAYSVSDGLAKPAQSDKVKVAGTTGTIQLPNGEYAVEFCGYFPADNPKYSVIVTINKKGLPASGGLMAGDAFNQIVDYIVKIEYELLQLITQDALESAWGRSAQGKFNFGNLTTGAKWRGDYVTGNDKNAKGEAIKQKFRSYNSMDEYAADKIQFLKRLYDFDENDDINKFTSKLTGSNKGKRRYAEATNYADSLTKVFNSFKKGGVIKAQVGTIMPDNTRVVKPTIQEKIQRTYPIQQQPQFVQDNRSDWEKQQSDNYKRQQEENEVLYNNQHLWNWSAPFNNTRLTKNNAKAMFDFNKSAGMSTFVTGIGIANPVSTATSMVGSMVGAGIGNEVAGEKGSIVGGLVGGLLGFSPRRSITPARKQASKSTTNDSYINLGTSFTSTGNPKMAINKSLDNFVEYLNQPETTQRLQNIDEQLGTQYAKSREWFLKELSNGNVRLNPREMWDGNNRVVNGMRYPNISQTVIDESFLSNPTYKNVRTDIVKQNPPSTVGHEIKHGIENYLEVLNKPNMTIEEFRMQHGTGKRLEALFDKENIKSFEEWSASIKADPQFKNATDAQIRNVYNYLTQPSEFSSNLHPMIEANMIKGRPGVPNYKDLADFEDVLNNSYYTPPWLAGPDPMMNTKLIYNHLIKDKNRFLNTFNRYGWSVAAPIGVSTGTIGFSNNE